MSNLRHFSHDPYIKSLEKICIYVVQWSCGLLEDIYVEWLATNDLLKCIVDRACRLLRLSLAKCTKMASLLKVESTKRPNWLDLPIDLAANILQRLTIIDLVSASLVCPLWWNICKDPLMWRNIDMTTTTIITPTWRRFVCMRLNGVVEGILIQWVASDGLLNYIADRASYLRRLSLVKCTNYSDKGFREFLKKLPMLEELYISENYICKTKCEAIGRFGPNLRRVEFCVAHLTEDKLLDILDGCPLLEYLHVHCTWAYLSTSFENRCCEQIKDFQILGVSMPYTFCLSAESYSP